MPTFHEERDRHPEEGDPTGRGNGKLAYDMTKGEGGRKSERKRRRKKKGKNPEKEKGDDKTGLFSTFPSFAIPSFLHPSSFILSFVAKREQVSNKSIIYSNNSASRTRSHVYGYGTECGAVSYTKVQVRTSTRTVLVQYEHHSDHSPAAGAVA